MNRRLALGALLAVCACGVEDASLSGGSGLSGSHSNKALDEPVTSESDLGSSESALTINTAHKPLCDVAGGAIRCYGRVRLNGQGTPFAASAPQGLTPQDLQAAYNLPSSGGAGMTVAIVDAQDNPRAESDLAVYRQQFGLPPCTTANGCFKKVNENGSTSSLPAADQGWAGEISLDLQMVSAACPNCKILLVEADQADDADLGAAENTAAALGANAISNSWGGGESSSVISNDSQYFNHPGIFITASSGDNGYGASYPATSAHVTAVGGTSLSRSSSARGWSETAWNGAGSGCSQYIAKPSWQHDTSCSMRMETDVSAVADPNTGVAVYDSYGSGGWTVIGGTSAASPLIAAIFALTNKTSQTSQFSYANTSDFYDVTSGSNGSCSSTYECRAGAGYDGPTGNGTPNGGAMAGQSGAGGGGQSGSGGGTASGGGSGSTGGGSGATGGGSGATGGGSGATGGGSGSTGGGSGSTGGGSGSTGGGAPGSGGGTTTQESEPNNTRGQANLLTVNVPMVGSISSSTDLDFFRISVTPGQTIDLVLSNLNADCDLRIYSSTGSLLAVSDNGGTTNEEISGQVSNSIYFARVNGYNGAKCSGYNLTLTAQ
jgi:hypothetical protein